MKKVFSFIAIAFIAVTVVFTSCRNDASTQGQTEQTEQTQPAAGESTAPAESAPQEATNAADTTSTPKAQ